ncbi:MAG: NAD-dependent epimerase/dehydratase family protein [Treponema sp.]|jgi:nucleoside-diphosphate-sugar epimerase|nr:NAD-dependent epimerase/dehydratase family protein [Treponema sp.]
MKALIIGGTGTISTDMVKFAIAQGWDMTLVNRGRRGKQIPPEAEHIECDARDEGAMKRALEGRYYDVVVNFIGFLPEQIEQDIRVFDGKCAQYIFISTCCVYQKPDGRWLTTESTPLRNVNSLYGQRKIACEETLNRAYREKNFPVTIVRPNWTYCLGTIPFVFTSWHSPWTLVDRLERGLPIIIPGDGQARFTITHAADFAVGLVGLMGNYHALGHAFHITGEEALTWNQYLELLERIVGVKASVVHVPTDLIVRLLPHVHDDIAGDKSVDFLFDNTKLRQFVPGFNPRISYYEGVKASIDYLRARPELHTIDGDYVANYDKVLSVYGPILDATAGA